MRNAKTIYKVSEINRYIKNLIQGDLQLRDIWVTGEISNFKHHRSGHMYFTVKDGNSSLRSVFFRRENIRCIFAPSDGMEVILHGNISVYEPDGVYQLYVFEMEPAGLGSLYIAYEQLKSKLEVEGLFRQELKKNIPVLPKKIALVTSPTGAALQDMIATVKSRFPYVQLLVVESLVQGAGAAADIVRALDLLNRRNDIDLIILARGGGSLEDLWPFNEEIVARAIHRSVIPVISAVGHETDFTIADFVADYRAATPTAAAQVAVPDLTEELITIRQKSERAALALNRKLQQEKQMLDYIVSERFFRLPVLRVKSLKDTLDRFDGEIKKEIIRQLKLSDLKLSALIDKLDSYSPLKVMNRGYSYCRDENGKIIRTIKDVKPGKLLNLNFKDGRAICRPEKIEEGKVLEG
ncbi:MAG: exodeoxyribonuclease VII large subunit [Firmicutes bacterium]|nr:exodeoxyribonuclease VII large subunit [Bacillota bacterium]